MNIENGDWVMHDHERETFKDLFPGLYKLNRIEETIIEFNRRVNMGGPFTRREQNQIATEATEKIREFLEG